VPGLRFLAAPPERASAFLASARHSAHHGSPFCGCKDAPPGSPCGQSGPVRRSSSARLASALRRLAAASARSRSRPPFTLLTANATGSRIVPRCRYALSTAAMSSSAAPGTRARTLATSSAGHIATPFTPGPAACQPTGENDNGCPRAGAPLLPGAALRATRGSRRRAGARSPQSSCAGYDAGRRS